ncbi:MAG: hypothetical protein IJP74_11500 [Prevotella sp.]|nr:hypothetical protein [Prevotella sp.]
MSKIYLVLLFLVASAIVNPVKAQRYTYYYVSNEFYDNNGVKHKQDRSSCYTFYGNICYESDANGNAKNSIVWRFHSQQNGFKIYKVRPSENSDFAIGLNNALYGNWQLSVTNDLSVINETIDGVNTNVYKRQAPQKKQSPQMIMPSK